ncbi:hypothetical protein PROFUN_10191 [Planoprotostelium fungivorum]|uniref:Uncharacterized protein n=1 Tax=Planoprotostelium fungivorum TaxID=1890364 RepID=A0A2P6MQ44_9EUKA|nr:hypothetical protein PROFUN_10191 [Planoprotostelium fungivorum]
MSRKNALLSRQRCYWFNRWFTFAAAFVGLFCGGTAYLWGSYSGTVKSTEHLTQPQLNLLGVSFYFSQVAGLAVGVAFDKLGPRPSALLIGGGYGLFRFGLIYDWPLPCLSLSLVLVGLGSSGMYSSVVGPNIANFDARHKGKVVGVLVAMYGGASAILSPIYKNFFQSSTDPAAGLSKFLLILSLGLGGAGLLAVIFINFVPKEENEKVSQEPTEESPLLRQDEERSMDHQKSLQEMAYPQSDWLQSLTSLNFWLLFFSFIIGVGAGSSVIATVGQLAESLGGSEVTATLVALQAVFNALSRPFTGTISDLLANKISRPAFLSFALLIYSFTHLWLSFSTAKMLYFGVVLIGFCYGTTYVLIPVMVNDLFGAKHWGVNYAIINCGPAGGNYLFVLLQAAIYKSHCLPGHDDCQGPECFRLFFWIVAAISALGFVLSTVLWFRTAALYNLKQSIIRQQHEKTIN